MLKISNISYDPENDHLYLKIHDLLSVEGEELENSGIVLRYGENNQVVGVEILGTSTHNTETIFLLKNLIPEAFYNELSEFFADLEPPIKAPSK